MSHVFFEKVHWVQKSGMWIISARRTRGIGMEIGLRGYIADIFIWKVTDYDV